jgi:predicted amidohydrolase YtcJ
MSLDTPRMTVMTRPLVPLVVLAVILCPSVAPARTSEADTVLLNGAILLFHGVERHDGADKPKFAQALAIVGGRIVFVGQDRKAKRYVGPRTRVIDLQGRMVMPGIVDGHFHGTRRTDCEMGYEGGTVAQVLARLQACLDRPEQAGLKQSNVRFSASHLFGEAILPPGTPLTRYDLDKLDTSRPVLVRNADGHKFWMNSRAIANARIDENTPHPPDG